MYKLSAYYLKKNYGPVTLITDDKGAKFLEGVAFETIRTDLNDLPREAGFAWGLGKIKAYGLAAEAGKPFIHADHDVFVAKPIPKDLAESGVFAQHKEIDIDGLYDLEKFHRRLPNKGLLERHRIRDAANMGIFGGTDLEFIARYSRESCGLVLDRSNLRFMQNTNFRCSWQPSVLFEQYYMTLMADYEDKKVGYLFKSENELKTEGVSLGYTHLWGVKHGERQIWSDKIYTILYYLGLNPRGTAPWSKGGHPTDLKDPTFTQVVGGSRVA